MQTCRLRSGGAAAELQRRSQISILQLGMTERQRIERDLHDGAQAMLISLDWAMGAAVASVADDADTRELIKTWRRKLQGATNSLRDLCQGIYPVALSQYGIRAGLKSLAEQQSQLHVELDVPEARFPESIETNLYFCVAEAVNNAVKHAEASKVHIRIKHESRRLSCTVSADGNGRAAVTDGSGLNGIRNRIRLLGGEFRRPHEPSMREAAIWIGVYVAPAAVFGAVLSATYGPRYSGEFFAGWLTEYSLSADNLFVFVIIMARFAVPRMLQQKVLLIGVMLALLMRGALIAVGAAAVDRFVWVFYLFGGFLIYTAIGLARQRQGSEASSGKTCSSGGADGFCRYPASTMAPG